MTTAQFNPEVRHLYQHLIKRNIAQSEQPSMLPPRYTGGTRYRSEVVAGTNPYYPMYHPELAMHIHSGGAVLGHPHQLAHRVHQRRVGGTNWDSIGKAFKGIVSDPAIQKIGLKVAKDLYGKGGARPRRHPVRSHMHGGGFWDDIKSGAMSVASNKGVQDFAGELFNDMINGKGSYKKRMAGEGRRHPLVHHRRGAGLNSMLFGFNTLGAKHSTDQIKKIADIWGGARHRKHPVRSHLKGGMKTPSWLKKVTATGSTLTGWPDPFNPSNNKYSQGLETAMSDAEYLANLYNTDTILDQLPSATGLVGLGRHPVLRHRRRTGGTAGLNRKPGGNPASITNQLSHIPVGLSGFGRHPALRHRRRIGGTAGLNRTPGGNPASITNQLSHIPVGLSGFGRHPALRHRRRTGGSESGGARGTRAHIVKKVMQEHGLSLPQASSFVKQHGLY